MKSNLCKIELYICLVFWIVSFVAAVCKLYQAQTELLKNKEEVGDLPDLEPGWKLLSRLKDTTDIEWSSWKYFFHISWPYLLIQFVITETLRRTEIFHLKYWYITSSFIFIALHFGYKQLLLILIQPVLYASIIFLGGNKLLIWALSLSLLMMYNSMKYKMFFWHFLNHETLVDEEVYLLLYCIPWVELRCISYCLDYFEMDKEKKSSKLECFYDMLSYCLYAPVLYTGPVIIYEDFKINYNAPHEKITVRLKKFIFDMVLFIFYMLMMDISLHYMYFYAMQANMVLIRKLPAGALCGGGLWMGVQFHVKYVVAYGVTSAFAKLDYMNTPPTPRCIARIHVYSQMWRYFDVGLYKFLLKYIYLPTTTFTSKYVKVYIILQKMLASLITFLFIFLWHGTIHRIFVWCVMNYFGITMEYVAKSVSATEYYKKFKEKVLRTDAMETRFIGLLCSPLLMLSAVSNFYLFAGTEVGDLYFESVLHPNFTNVTSVCICLSLYCCCIVSMALQDTPSRKAEAKPSYNAISNKVK